jgi:H+/Cl- antiporter ClcA
MTPWALEAGDSLKRLLQGAAAGALIMVIVGFTWGGWTLGSTVKKVAKEHSGPTIAAPLPPLNVD